MAWRCHQCLAVCVALFLGTTMLLPPVACVIQVPSSVKVQAGKDFTFKWNATKMIMDAEWGLKDAVDDKFGTKLIYTDIAPTLSILPQVSNSAYKGRVSFVGNLTAGHAWFKLSNLSVNDTNTYGTVLREDGETSVFSSARLIVTVTPQFTTVPPSSKTIQEGDDLSIQCSAKGPPPPQVKWLHNGSSLSQGYGGFALLNIVNIKRSQSGIYECQASNHPNEEPATTTTNITVYYKPRINNANSTNSIRSWKGNTIALKCVVSSAFPSPDFTWYKPNGDVIPCNQCSKNVSSQVTVQTGQDSGDYGLYRCIATNVVGSDQHFINVTQLYAASFTPSAHASVRCLKDAMYIHLMRSELHDFNETNLSLKDTSCRATANKTHYTLKAPLVGCGTKVQFAHEAVVYSNMVKEYRQDGMITRIQDVRVPFNCFYAKEGVTSTFGILPINVRRTMHVGNVTTKFHLGMSLYRNVSYSVSFGIADFPLRVTFNKPLFVQVNIDSPDNRLTVLSERCYATPTQDPRHPLQYDIIVHGCAMDPTVKFYEGPRTVQRFSLGAFQFLANGSRFIYLHCHVLVCNVTDTASRCAQGCLSSLGRSRRSAPLDFTEVTQGPFILEIPPVAQQQQQSGLVIKDNTWIIVGMAGFCVLCLIAIAYMKIRQPNNAPAPPDPNKENHI